MVMLGGSLPFLVTTKAHFLAEDRPSLIVLADVIDNWMNVATATHNNCITVVDSYYTSHEAYKCFQQSNKMVLAACKKSCFKAFKNLLSKTARDPKTQSLAYNKAAGDSPTYRHSANPKIGAKLVVYSMHLK